MGTCSFCLRGLHFSSPGGSTSVSLWENHVSLTSLVWERSGCDTTADFGVRHEPEAWPIGSPHPVTRLVPGGCPAQMGLTKISPKSWVPRCVLSHLTWAQARRRGSFKDVSRSSFSLCSRCGTHPLTRPLRAGSVQGLTQFTRSYSAESQEMLRVLRPSWCPINSLQGPGQADSFLL